MNKAAALQAIDYLITACYVEDMSFKPDELLISGNPQAIVKVFGKKDNYKGVPIKGTTGQISTNVDHIRVSITKANLNVGLEVHEISYSKDWIVK